MPRVVAFLWAALAALGGSSGLPSPIHAQQLRYAVPEETEDGWPTASLPDVGLDPEPFDRLLLRLHNTDGHLIHSILVVRDGALVFEVYFDGSDVNLFDDGILTDCTVCLEERRFTEGDLHFAASVTKSVTSLAVGIAVDRGEIAGTDAQMFSFFPDYAHLRTPAKDRITLHHMLSMTSGLPFDEATYPLTDPRNDAHRLFTAENPVTFVLGADVVYDPGTTYEYNSGTTVLLGEILRRSTGRSVPDFAEEYLFAPLGITASRWATCPRAPEVTLASGGLYLRPRDMAKIGQLMLQGGVWDGRQIVSSDWVRRSLTMATRIMGRDRGHAYGYGYQWRLGHYGGLPAFYAMGWGGQYVVVIPELELVFVQTAGAYAGEHLPLAHDTIVERYVLPAVRRR